MTASLQQVNTTAGSGETFGTTIDKLNQVINAVATQSVTANTNANGSVTTGNTFVNGIFTATTLTAATTLRGGNVQSVANLSVTSNVSVGNTTSNVFLGFGFINVGNTIALNTAGLFVGANLIANLTTVFIGNSTVSTTITNGLISTGNVAVIGNVSVGNSTVNSVINSTSLVTSIGNFSSGVNAGANVNVTTTGYQIGNTTVNIQANSSMLTIAGINVATVANRQAVAKNNTLTGVEGRLNLIEGTGIALTMSDDTTNKQINVIITATGSATTTATDLVVSNTVTVGNSSVNLFANATIISFSGGNTINSTVWTGQSLTANDTSHAFGKLEAGLNVNNAVNFNGHAEAYYANVTNPTISGNIAIGNSSVSVYSNSSIIQVANTTATTNVSVASVALGNVIVNTNALFVGNSTINTTINQTTYTVTNGSVSTAINTTAMVVGSGNTINSTVWSGSTTFFAGQAQSYYANVTSPVFSTNMTVGSSTVNTFVNSTYVVVGNTTINTILNQSSLAIGNSSVNTFVNSTSFYVSGDHVLLAGTSNNITKGFTFTPFNAGTATSGTFTPDPTQSNYQYYQSNGTYAIGAPSSDCAIDLLANNGTSAGTVTFTGYNVSSSTGDPFDTTSGHKFLIAIRRINGVSTYVIKALQ